MFSSRARRQKESEHDEPGGETWRPLWWRRRRHPAQGRALGTSTGPTGRFKKKKDDPVLKCGGLSSDAAVGAKPKGYSRELESLGEIRAPRLASFSSRRVRLSQGRRENIAAHNSDVHSIATFSARVMHGRAASCEA